MGVKIVIFFLMSSVAINDDLLNFCYFSATFHKYISDSAKIFQKMKKEEDKKKILGNGGNLIKDNFDLLNNENYMSYLDNLSFLHEDDDKRKNYKISVVNSFIGNIFSQNKKEKENQNESILLYKLKEKFNMSILPNKFEFVKLISTQTIHFFFDIYELIYKLFKNMEESCNEKIQKIVTENLISESEVNTSKKKLSKEIIDLKNKIEIQRQLLKKNEVEKEKLIEKKNNLESEIKKLKTDLKNLQNQLILSTNESNDKIKYLIKELKDTKKQESLLGTELSQSKEKIIHLEAELRTSKEKLSLLESELTESKEKLDETRKESKEKLSLLESDLAKSKEKLSLLQEELNKTRKESKEELEKTRKESKDIFNDMKQEIEKLKISNNHLNEKIKNIEGGYNHMKSLNTQIIFDGLKTNEENLEHKPEAYMDANSLVRILNLMSIDYESVNNKLREKEKEIEELKKEPKQK